MNALTSPVSLSALLAGLSYLNARWYVSYDWHFVQAIAKSLFYLTRLDRADQQNTYYTFEAWALNPKTADNLYLVYQGREWSYKQAYEQILRHGAWLRDELRVAPGDVVAIDMMNSDRFIWVWFGLWSVGAKPAFINYNLSGKALCHCVRIAGPHLLLVDEHVRANVDGAPAAEMAADSFYGDKGKGPVAIVYLDQAATSAIDARPPVRQPDALRARQARNDLAMIIYTSGTTGLPKAGIVPWLRYNRGSAFFANIARLTPADRFHTAMPLYHTAASMLAAGTSLYAGAALVLDHRFSLATFWPSVRGARATVIQYVGETCRYLLNAPASPLDTQHGVRLALGNGLRPDVWARFKARFGIDTVVEFYGATEGVGTLINVSRNAASAGAIGRTGSLLRAALGGSVAVVDTDPVTEEPRRDPATGLCVELGRGPVGELCNRLNEKDIAETYVGYYNNARASEKKILRDVRAKGDAFFRTGDLVRFDADGRCFFVDRIGDTFRWKSENVATSEVAEALGAHPAVAEANVYGVRVPHHDGRAGCAAIVLAGGEGGKGGEGARQPDAALLRSLADLASKTLTRFARPVFLRFTPAFETTGTNKTVKHALREQGVDPARVAGSAPADALFWLRGETYVPFTPAAWAELAAGRITL